MSFRIIIDTITPAIQATRFFFDDVIDEAQDVANRMLEDAKANAPWDDRTGDARDGLDVEVREEGDDVVIDLFHTVEYGQWLETIQSGRYAIIMPTLEKWGPELQRAVGGKLFFSKE